ncbi:hypothetical protein [Ferrimonas marina]|uniref:Lipoprotein n=1 Tax=Ferrimonas marina TaxID=299255 RepID=A0A1M5QY25_9GAMM|nr:hypothetical protein [Ferrimonas marina]SHH18788.1 hypothetical protein SAMN02745129_1400 [Ferrimonas marina]
MKLNQLFPLSVIASALMLSACGGDININAGESNVNPPETSTPTTPPPTEEEETDFDAKYPFSTDAGYSVGGKNVRRIVGVQTADIRLENDVVWELAGAVQIGGDNTDSATITIDAGTLVLGDSEGYLVISRGSMIEAAGTAEEPIVFTSVEAGLGQATARGQWGGLVLLGNAKVNTCADHTVCDVPFEVGDHPYGGDNDDDNSGTLRYVRVENGGFKVNDTQEMNGISFAAVGRGTTVEYIQIDNNDDDGIEFWGGTVNVKYVVLTNNNDDSLDWTHGWTGHGQYFYIATEDDNANRGIEADSSKTDPLGTPTSMPYLANLTLNLGGGTNGGGDDAEGILFRVDTGAHLYNALVKGGPTTGECLEVNDATTVARANANELTMSYSLIDCVEPFKSPKDDMDNVLLDVEAWFMAQDGNLAEPSYLEGYQPMANSPALGGGHPNLAGESAFFEDNNYIGAFDGNPDNDWTLGWTIGIHDAPAAPAELVALEACPEGTTNSEADAGLIAGTDLVCSVNTPLTSNTVLQAGTNVWYKLDGAVVVGGDKVDSATLAIEPGVKVFGEDNGYLVISRGSKIAAAGTAEMPIVFTSRDHALGEPTFAGQWGGLVLLGNAQVNTCVDKNVCDIPFEVGAHNYGGNNDEDSSGELSYVQVLFGGFKVNDTQEMNGVSFAGVGSGTKVNNIHVHMNDDDGVEFWGGTVNIRNIYLTGNNDDSLDWTHGWRGKGQNIYISQVDNGANRGIEADSSKSDPLGLPYSDPWLSNVTIEVAGGTNGGGDDAEGILFRVATRARLHNAIVKGTDTSGECLEINNDGTVDNAVDGTLVMTHSLIDCVEPVKDTPATDSDGNPQKAHDTNAWFLAQEGNQILEFGALALTAGQPAADSVALGAGLDLSSEDAFFESTNYIGAFDGTNDWTAGWSYQSEQ